MRMLLAAALSMGFTQVALAQDIADCGDPPPVANEELRGEIEGKAQILSRFLGDVALSGNIQTSRTEIFSKYGDAELARSNAYFEYQVCVFLMGDKSLTNLQKLNELKKIRREFSQPVRTLDNTLEEVDDFDEIEKITREVVSPAFGLSPESKVIDQVLVSLRVDDFKKRVADEGRLSRRYKKTIEGVEYQVEVRTETRNDCGQLCRLLAISKSGAEQGTQRYCKSSYGWYSESDWTDICRSTTSSGRTSSTSTTL